MNTARQTPIIRQSVSHLVHNMQAGLTRPLRDSVCSLSLSLALPFLYAEWIGISHKPVPISFTRTQTLAPLLRPCSGFGKYSFRPLIISGLPLMLSNSLSFLSLSSRSSIAAAEFLCGRTISLRDPFEERRIAWMAESLSTRARWPRRMKRARSSVQMSVKCSYNTIRRKCKARGGVLTNC